MAEIGKSILRADGVVEPAGSPELVRWPFLRDDNDGVRFAFVLGFPWSYPGGPRDGRPAAGAPANLAVVRDLSEHSDGLFRLSAGPSPAFASGGFDMAGVTVGANNALVEAPASVSADIYASQVASGNQEYLMWGYWLIPASADWVTAGGTTANIMEIGAYNGANDLVSLAMVDQFLGFRHHQKNGSGSTVSVTAVVPPSYATLAQIAVYRKAGSARARVRTAAGTNYGAAQVNGGALGNYSANTPRWGMLTFWNSGVASEANARKHTLLGGAVENLVRSGRDPETVLDADWATMTAFRAAYFP